ncbi:hypothetical protein B0J14DRAFT_670064 [Halenospora varia]|nr:hypothetical protein B0J14DRAFT_670064 [Halenospora varia]
MGGYIDGNGLWVDTSSYEDTTDTTTSTDTSTDTYSSTYGSGLYGGDTSSTYDSSSLYGGDSSSTCSPLYGAGDTTSAYISSYVAENTSSSTHDSGSSTYGNGLHSSLLSDDNTSASTYGSSSYGGDASSSTYTGSSLYGGDLTSTYDSSIYTGLYGTTEPSTPTTADFSIYEDRSTTPTPSRRFASHRYAGAPTRYETSTGTYSSKLSSSYLTDRHANIGRSSPDYTAPASPEPWRRASTTSLGTPPRENPDPYSGSGGFSGSSYGGEYSGGGYGGVYGGYGYGSRGW